MNKNNMGEDSDKEFPARSSGNNPCREHIASHSLSSINLIPAPFLLPFHYLPSTSLPSLLPPRLLLLRIIHQKLMQSTTRRDHGQNRNLLINHDLQKRGSRTRTFNQPEQILLERRQLPRPTRRDMHSLGQLDEIRVALVGVGEAVLVEKTLPLGDHALFLVVEDEDFDADVEFGGGAELGLCHEEGGVAVDVDYEFVGLGDFGADGRGEAVAHRAEAAGGDHAARGAPAEVLGGPHLVLADAGGDDGFVFARGGEVGERVDDGLGLDQGVGVVLLLPGPGEALFPGGDLVEPFFAVGLGAGFDEWEDRFQVFRDVAFNSLVGLNDLIDILGHDLEMDDTSTALCGGETSLRSEFGDAAGDAVVETSTECEDEIGLLH